MLRPRSIAFVALLLMASFALATDFSPAAEATSPRETVRAFYEFLLKHDMGFTRQNLADRAKWLDKSLYDACLTELERLRSPDVAPRINGDPFTYSQEYPASFKLGKHATKGERSVIVIVFSWPSARRTAEIVLKRTDRRWLIDDIRYHDGKTLRDLLATP